MSLETKRLINTGYRSAIPFHILFDNRMTANHIRLYGLICQIESNPNTTPIFDNKYFADQCGIKIRQVQNISKDLRDWGYAERYTLNNNRAYGWKTTNEQG